MEHQGAWPPAAVQLLCDTPCQVKGKVQLVPAVVTQLPAVLTTAAAGPGQQVWPEAGELPTLWQCRKRLSGSQADTGNNGIINYLLELETNLLEDFTITEKAPMWAFLLLKAPTATLC